MKKNNRPISNNSIKKAGSNIMSTKASDNKNQILVRDNQTTPGNGLWCVNLEKKRDNNYYNLTTIKENQVNSMGGNKQTEEQKINPNSDIDAEFEKKIISQLKFQVKDLTSKLQIQMNKYAEAEYRASWVENNKQNYLELIERKSKENKELEEKMESFENTIINLNEALANAKKEISRLQNENSIESEKSRNYYEMYQSLMIDKERREAYMNNEMNGLNNKINIINNEKENLLKMLRSQSIDKNLDLASNLQKMSEEKENQLRTVELQMNKILNENADIKRKFAAEEQTKSKLNEIIKKKKAKILKLKEELQGYKEVINNYNNDVKWNQDLVSQKDNQIKIFKEKIKKYEEENNKLNKLIENLKKKKNNNETGNNNNQVYQEEVQSVKAKPFLFGPESEEY